jgi:hypothetical protein
MADHREDDAAALGNDGTMRYGRGPAATMGR